MKRLMLAAALVLGLVTPAQADLDTDTAADDSRANNSDAAGEPRFAQVAEPAEASPTEVVFWQSIQKSGDPADFEAYLQRYPNGAFVLLARNRLKNLMESPIESMAVIALDVTELNQNTALKNAIRRLAESKYRIEIERFVSMTIKNTSSTGITIDLTYLWRRDDTSQRFGRGKATMQEVGWGYKVVDVESIIPTAIQLLRFGQDPGI